LHLFSDFIVGPVCSELAVSDSLIMTALNDYFGDLRCVATKILLRAQRNAAPAKARNSTAVLSAVLPSDD
jgi:hypothetical protein